jgi:hypothetical protein
LLLSNVGAELKRVIEAINAALDMDGNPGTDAVGLPSDYNERLQALASQIAKYDGEASDTLDALMVDVGAPEVSAQLVKLGKLVGQYEYDAALAIINEMTARAAET